MQIQRLLGNTGSQHFVQDAFHLAFRIDVAVRVLGTREEIGRGHLLRVAGDDDLPAAGNRADGVPHRDLGTLRRK